MPFTPDSPNPKKAGDAIRSKDWNDLITETQRLDTAKVNRSGDAITGPLTVAGGLRFNDSNAYLRGGSDTNHGLGWFGASKLFGGANIDGPVLFGWSGGALGTTNGGQKAALTWNNAGKIGIGAPAPKAALHVVGPALISDGDGYAVPNNRMASGSLTIGSLTSNFGGGNNWNSNTAGLLMETLDNTEIAIHDSGTRIASVVQYLSASNSLTIGRDMGWGAISSVILNGNVGIGTASPDRTLDIAGTMRAGGEIQTTSPNAFRMVCGNHGSFLRNDSNDTYLLLTNSGDQYGSWNNLRPLRINNASGDVYLNGSSLYVRASDGSVGIGTTDIKRTLHVQGSEIHSGGGGSGFSFANRQTAGFVESPTQGERWVWYANGGTASLWSGSNKLSVTKDGEIRVTGKFLEVNGSGNERCYIGGDGAGNDVQIGSFNAGVTNISAWNISTGYMNVICKNLTQTSDLTLKKNVTPLTSALDTICSLQGVRFDWKSEKNGPKKSKALLGKNIGLIAQEVAKILPEVVSESRGTLSVSYTALVPLLVEAVKELKARIDNLEMPSIAPKAKTTPKTK